MDLYLHQNDQQTGPFSEDQVRQMMRAGTITADTMAWKQGMTGWKRLSEFVSLDHLGVLPAAAPQSKSVMGIVSLVISIVGLIGWAVLLVIAGLAHNNGTATQGFNVIVGLFFMGGICLNFIGFVLGLIAAFSSNSKTIPILGACLNGFEVAALIGLMILGLSMAHSMPH